MKTIRLVTAALYLLPATAAAHPGHGGSGFLDGLLHPLLGADHLAAVIAVGLLAAHLPPRTQPLPVAVFLGSSLAGALAALGGSVAPGGETMIAASVLLLGVLLALLASTPRALAVALAGVLPLCGWFHGQAHVAAATVASSGYIGGFLAGTALLHLLGYRAGTAAGRHGMRWPLWAGASVGAFGVFLLAGL